MGASYVYLLGLYLGDGNLSRHPRDVWCLRISQDSRYRALIEACVYAIYEVSGHHAGTLPRTGCHEIYSCWKHWLCIFPQHGPGPKHKRSIVLVQWQRELVIRYPRQLVKGLVESDGCRVINPVVSSAGKRYEYSRYHFSNRSDDIRALFVWGCALIGVECRPNNQYNISVARRRSVAIVDEFIGPKR